MAAHSPNEPTRWSMLESMRDPGNEGAWAWFMARYRPYAAAVLTRLGLRRDEVDAALDEFWGYLFRTRAIDSAEPTTRFRSFFAGVVRNFGHSWLRSERSGATPLVGDVVAPPAVENDLALWGDHLVQLALGRLAAAHANEARALRWFYGLGERLGEAGEQLRGSEIADRLGCKPNAVHQMLFRARAHLRTHLETEVAATGGSPQELRDELHLLLAAVGTQRPGLLLAEPAPDPPGP